jgi:YD repeat-containing protein
MPSFAWTLTMIPRSYSRDPALQLNFIEGAASREWFASLLQKVIDGENHTYQFEYDPSGLKTEMTSAAT